MVIHQLTNPHLSLIVIIFFPDHHDNFTKYDWIILDPQRVVSPSGEFCCLFQIEPELPLAYDLLRAEIGKQQQEQLIGNIQKIGRAHV